MISGGESPEGRARGYCFILPHEADARVFFFLFAFPGATRSGSGTRARHGEVWPSAELEAGGWGESVVLLAEREEVLDEDWMAKLPRQILLQSPRAGRPFPGSCPKPPGAVFLPCSMRTDPDPRFRHRHGGGGRGEGGGGGRPSPTAAAAWAVIGEVSERGNDIRRSVRQRVAADSATRDLLSNLEGRAGGLVRLALSVSAPPKRHDASKDWRPMAGGRGETCCRERKQAGGGKEGNKFGRRRIGGVVDWLGHGGTGRGACRRLTGQDQGGRPR